MHGNSPRVRKKSHCSRYRYRNKLHRIAAQTISSATATPKLTSANTRSSRPASPVIVKPRGPNPAPPPNPVAINLTPRPSTTQAKPRRGAVLPHARTDQERREGPAMAAGGAEQRIVAVIMVGGPTKGTRFRPLSLNVPKPLFPLAGQPMVHHPISACRRIPNLAQIYLIGFYEEREFALYVSSISNELRIPVRYLREDKPHGSAGGLYSFRDYIMEDSPSHIVLLNCDVCSSFPLPDMLEAHKKYGGMGTLLVNKVSAESANQFGELVADPETNELLHYTEKPETFVSDLINCGVYMFTPNIFNAIEDVLKQKKDRANLRRVSSFEALQSAMKALPADYVRLDQDILSPLAGKKELYTYQTLDFWEQIKTPGMSLRCSGLYLSQFRRTTPHLLASGDGKRSATIIGDVYIHPSAKVHPTAKIGPNVSISANARIGAGARLINCIILDDVEIMENAVVIHSIVGWKSTIGKWSRVQGEGDHNAKLGITILGEAVDVEDEVVVTNSIVLPNKTLNVSVQEEIIL